MVQATLEAKLLEAVQSSSSAVASLSLQSAPLAVGVTPPALGRSPSQDPPSLTPPETASGGVVASAQQRWAGAPMPTLQEELLKLGTEQQRLRAEQQRLQVPSPRRPLTVTQPHIHSLTHSLPLLPAFAPGEAPAAQVSG